MPRTFAAPVMALALGLALTLAGEASAQPLRLGGTGGAMGMAEQVAAAYSATGAATIAVITGLGSSGAISAVVDGVIDLAVSGRPLKPAEAERGLVSVPIARTPLVFATSRLEPAGLTAADLPAVFSAVAPKWPDGAALSIILRPASDSDVALVTGYFPGLEQAMAAARQRPEVPVAATDQDNATLAEELPGSLIHTGLSQIVTERRNLRLVVLDGVEPTLQNLGGGAYPYEKSFYLVYAERNAPAAEALVAFLRSPQGQIILRDSGCLPLAQ